MMKTKITEEPNPDYIHTDPTEFPAWTEVGKVGSRVHIPVSYTHLTLPTILRV